MREDPRIFFAHTLRHLLVEDVPSPLDRQREHFSGVRSESGLRDEYAALQVAPMGTPWLLVIGDPSMLGCGKKARVLN
jgi:hypothetical protein